MPSHAPQRTPPAAVALVRASWGLAASVAVVAFLAGLRASFAATPGAGGLAPPRAAAELLAALRSSFPACPGPGDLVGARAALAFLAANAVAYALATRLATRAVLRDGAVALAHGLALAWLLHGPDGAGDSAMWRGMSASRNAWLSEAGAHVAYVAGRAAGSIDLVPPVFGALTAWTLLVQARHVGRAIGVDERRASTAAFALYLASPVPFLFAYGYVETPQLSLPFLLIAIATLARAAGGGASLARGAAWLGAACFVHGASCTFVPLLPLAAWLRHAGTPGAPRAALRDVGLGALALTGAAALGLAATLALGFELFPGNVGGGGDGRQFVPLRPNPDGIPTLLSPAHLVLAANVALLALPALPALAVPLLRPAGRRALESSRPLTLLLMAALGYLGFVFLQLFDYGYPRDADLMFAPSVVLALAVSPLVLVLAGPRATRWLPALVLVGGSCVWTELARRFPLATPAPRDAVATWADGPHAAPHEPAVEHRRRTLRRVRALLDEHGEPEAVEALLRADPSLSLAELELALRRLGRLVGRAGEE